MGERQALLRQPALLGALAGLRYHLSHLLDAVRDSSPLPSAFLPCANSAVDVRSGQLIDGAMGSCGSGWTEDQVYVCGTLLQAASFPGFLLGGHLVDKLGVSRTAARFLARWRLGCILP